MRRDKPETICFQKGSAAHKINTPLPLRAMINCSGHAASSQTAFLIHADSDQIPRYHKHNPLCLAWPLLPLFILIEEFTHSLLHTDLCVRFAYRTIFPQKGIQILCPSTWIKRWKEKNKEVGDIWGKFNLLLLIIPASLGFPLETLHTVLYSWFNSMWQFFGSFELCTSLN